MVLSSFFLYYHKTFLILSSSQSKRSYYFIKAQAILVITDWASENSMYKKIIL